MDLNTDSITECLELASGADLVVVQREAAAHPFASRLHEFTRRNRIPLIFDLDDLLLFLPRLHPDRQAQVFSEALLPIFRLLMESDAVTVCSYQLKQLVEVLNPCTYVLPNYIDDTAWEIREHPRTSDTVRIIYLGTQSHRSDLAEIQPAILQALRVLGDKARFEIVGFAPNDSLRPLALEDNVIFDQFFEYDYLKFVRKANKIYAHIGIAPLSNNLFNRSKSMLKLLEYTCMGLAGIYSNVQPYSDEVHSRGSGLLVSSIEEWIDGILTLAKDETLRLSIVRAARERLQDFRLSVHAQSWERQIEEVAELASDASRRAQSVNWQLLLKTLESIDVQLHERCDSLHSRREAAEAALEEERRRSREMEAALEEERRRSREMEAALEEERRRS
ncbi:MAG: glycosyltransferase, partial [Anaerolineae bacterium]|nr:glycosyltransferase [Anaerolineae bacterium]